MDREYLRKQLRILRDQQPTQTQALAAEAICERVLSLPAFQAAARIALYVAKGSEVSTVRLMQASFALKKLIYLPRIQSISAREMQFLAYQKGAALAPNRYGIDEPSKENPAISVDALEVVFVPMIGFDENCHRLGTGGGFYDKAFTNARKPILCGLAYECQKVKAIAPAPWDVPLDYVMTERACYTA